MVCDPLVKKRFWHLLTHTTTKPEDKESILRYGFDTSRNPWNGIFAFDIKRKVFEIGPGTIFMDTDDRCKIVDLGGDRPMDNYRGVGSRDYNKIYVDCAKEGGFNLPYTEEGCDWNWYGKNSDDIEMLLRKRGEEGRMFSKQTECIRDKLLEEGNGIVINGGEIIIIDKNCIKKMW